MEPCTIWQGQFNSHGYPIAANRKQYGTMYAHRQAYMDAHGPIPEGYHIDHLCEVVACVNPNHLEAVTPAENARRSHKISIGGTCRKGLHVWDARSNQNGTCVECRRASTNIHAQKRRKTFRAANPTLADRGVCRQGHDLTVLGKDPDGRCSECRRIKVRRYQARQRKGKVVAAS